MKDIILGLCAICGKEIIKYQPLQKRKDELLFCNDVCLKKYEKIKDKWDMGYRYNLKNCQSQYDQLVNSGEAVRISLQKTLQELSPEIKAVSKNEKIIAVLESKNQQDRIQTTLLATESKFIVLDKRSIAVDAFEIPYEKIIELKLRKLRTSQSIFIITVQVKLLSFFLTEPEDHDYALELLKMLCEKMKKALGKNIIVNYRKALMFEEWWFTVPHN